MLVDDYDYDQVCYPTSPKFLVELDLGLSNDNFKFFIQYYDLNSKYISDKHNSFYL